MILNKNIYVDKKTDVSLKEFMGLIDIEQESRNLSCFLCKTRNFELISDKDRYGLFYPTGVCLDCGHVQQTSYLNAESLNIFYESHYRDIYKTGSPEELFLSQYFKAAKKIDNFIGSTSKKNILEVGCGPGGILKHFQDKYNSQVLGIDLDQRYLDFGKENGVNLINSTIEDYESKQKYDLIVVCHVLEHLNNPIDFLVKLRSLLDENGSIYIEVPSLESVKNGAYGKNLQNFFHIAHISHFTEKSIQRLIYLSDYEITKFNNTIQVLIQDSSKKDKNLLTNEPNSYKYTKNLLKEISNSENKFGFLFLNIFVLFFYRKTRLRDLVNLAKIRIFKSKYNSKN